MTFHLLPNPPTLICMKLIRHLVSVVSHSHWHCRSPLSQPLTVPLTLYRMREGCHINLCNHNTCRRISNHRNFCGSCCVWAEEDEEEEASPGITPHDRLLSPFALATRLPPSQQQYSSNNNIHSPQVQVTKGDTLFSAIPQPIQESTPRSCLVSISANWHEYTKKSRSL